MKAAKSNLTLSFFLISGCLTAPTAEIPAAEEAADEESDASTGTETSGASIDDGPIDDGPSFVPIGDMPSGPECEDLGSDECGPGRKCTLAWTDDNELTQVCADLVDDPLAAGSACELGEAPGEDACGADAVCWDAGNGMGSCLRFCNDINDYEAALAQCGEGFTCNYFKSLPGDDALCTPTCEPMQDECPGTCGCFWVGSEFMCVPLTENFATGQPCGFVNDCAMDNYCADAAVMPDCAGSACCAAYCEFGSACAQPGTECVTFFEAGTAPPGLETLGLCISP